MWRLVYIYVMTFQVINLIVSTITFSQNLKYHIKSYKKILVFIHKYLKCVVEKRSHSPV